MSLLRFMYKIGGRVDKFNAKLHKQVHDSFDELQFPGIRQIIPSLKEEGCFVTFATKDQAKQVLQELGNMVTIGGHTKRAYLVQVPNSTF